jgi:FMN phosphatase YigB (HAD superfamily)
LISGTLDTLEMFLAKGHRLALLSNIWTPYFRSVRQLLGPFFDAHIPAELQILSCREGLTKPAPELFARLLQRARADASATLMVGDSYEKDIQPAISCGMRTLWLVRDPVRDMPALLQVLNGRAVAPTAADRSLPAAGSDIPLLHRLLPHLTAAT